MKYIADLIEKLKGELENALETSDFKKIKGSEVYSSIENLIQDIDKTAETLIHFTRSERSENEGYLVRRDDGGFELCGKTLNCGDYLELWNDELGQYEAGTVEHNGKDYYFCNSDMEDPVLQSGIKARSRVDKH